MDCYEYCIGSPDSRFKKTVTAILNQAGYRSVGEATSIPLLLRLLRTVQPWLVVIDTAIPPGNVQELANIIESDSLSAAIYINTGAVEISEYVTLGWPVDDAVFKAVARTVCIEFARKKGMHSKIASLESKLIEKNLINRAKTILINRYNLSEDEAHRALQKLSMNEKVSMASLAEKVIRSPGSFGDRLPHR